jgi:cytochrome c oxidase assembly protein subunit 15
VSVHLILGNAFCITLLWLASDFFERSARPVERPAIAFTARWLAAAVVVCLFFQLLLGGLVSSRYAGLACLDFPTCDGVSLAPTLAGPVGLQVLHRLNGLLLLLAICPIAWLTRKLGRAGKLAQTAAFLVVLQIGLGAANVLLRLPFELTAVHTGAAAAIALTVALLVREIRLSPGEERTRALSRLVEAR